MTVLKISCALIILLAATGCALRPVRPMPALAPHVELSRFMGDWYVIASVPIFMESDSYDGVESYQQDAQGRILTTYTFRKGSFSGPVKTFRPVATVFNHATNSEWRMQFIWPFKSGYLIHYISDDYSATIIGEPHVRNVWIMARTPHIPEDLYQALVSRVADLGYDVSKLRRVPQK